MDLHPFKAEISELLENPPVEYEFGGGGGGDDVVLDMKDEYVWIENEVELKELAELLSNERVFAVDTEQHSFRSFLGFTALIQVLAVISCGNEDMF